MLLLYNIYYIYIKRNTDAICKQSYFFIKINIYNMLNL